MNEKELIQKTLKGEEGAFDLLVQHNRVAVYGHCYSIVHDEGIAQDLTQETFVHAFQHLASFQMRARFSTWVWRIAHNLSLNYLKKKHLMELEYKEEIRLPSITEENEKNEDLLAQVYQAMAHLSQKHRIVLEMYDLKHIPQKEIASELGIAYGTVRSRLFYARKKIREFLQNS